jgi:polyisoprenoid-binding protein YceI
MKTPPLLLPRRLPRTAALAALVFFCLGPATLTHAQTRYGAQPRGNSVKVDGTSTAHDWEMEGAMIGGFIEFGPGVQLDPAQTAIAGTQGGIVPAKARAVIPVASIHSKAEHMPDVMDHLMQGAMKEEQCKIITYSLTELTFKGPHTPGKPFAFESKGQLLIAGVTNKVSFPITIECLDAGKIKVSGTAPVKMTDYGVTPPAPNFGLGLMKCGDDVKIIFDWTLEKKAAQEKK